VDVALNGGGWERSGEEAGEQVLRRELAHRRERESTMGPDQETLAGLQGKIFRKRLAEKILQGGEMRRRKGKHAV